MTFIPVMWTVWSALVLILVAIWLYRARLERDEEDQIFLDDSFDHERAAQAAIVAKVNKVQPIFKIALVLASLATAWVIVYYVRDILHQF